MKKRLSLMKRFYLHINSIAVVAAAVMLIAGISFVVLHISNGVVLENDEQVATIMEKDTLSLMDDGSSDSESVDDKYKEVVPDDGQYRNIVCWGDSMTSGVGNSIAVINKDGIKKDISYYTYPMTLEELTGIKVFNYGVPGATSEEIAIMQGAIEPALPLDEYPGVNYDIMEAASEIEGEDNILILEIGSNGGWDSDYETLIEQYKTMIEHANCDYYIIVGDTDDPGTSIGDLNQTETNTNGSFIGGKDTMWEKALRDAFGDHFINMRTYIIENGLSMCGLRTTMLDKMSAQKGFISKQLRADWTHFNSFGYYVKGVAIYEKGVQLGYWN